MAINDLTKRDRETLMQHLANRASADPSFMGYELVRYKAAHNFENDTLAYFLECKPAALIRLALCRRPDATDERLLEEVQRIAAHAACSPFRLLLILLWVTERPEARKDTAGLGLSSRGSDAWPEPAAISAKPRD